MINTDFKFQKFENPFPYIVIENFLEQNFYEKLETDFPNIDEVIPLLEKISPILPIPKHLRPELIIRSQVVSEIGGKMKSFLAFVL